MKKRVMLVAMLLAAGPAFAQSTTASTPGAAEATKSKAGVSAGPAPAASAAAAKAMTPEARLEQRITAMHRRLKITPEQESNWHVFAQAMRDNVTATDRAYRERRASIETMSAPDNMQNFAQIEQARAQGVQNLATSFQTLYGSFSNDQKKTADTLFRHYQVHGGQAHGRQVHGEGPRGGEVHGAQPSGGQTAAEPRKPAAE